LFSFSSKHCIKKRTRPPGRRAGAAARAGESGRAAPSIPTVPAWWHWQGAGCCRFARARRTARSARRPVPAPRCAATPA